MTYDTKQSLCLVRKLLADTIFCLPPGGRHTLSVSARDKRQLPYLSLTAVLIMDDLQRELLEDLDDDSDSSDGNSSKGSKKSKLPLVNPMCAGKLLCFQYRLQ